MPIPEYNPFGKNFSEVTTNDLASLRTVKEGWYIEYKRDVPSAKSIAKSLSAFANTYGGWLFYGIEQQSHENPVAGTFVGLTLTEASGCEVLIRGAAANSLSPTPFFESKILSGPNMEIGLGEGRSIIAVYVNQSFLAPHIHQDGRIYRRVGDSSEPKPETDRNLVEMLFERGKDRKEKLKTLFAEHSVSGTDISASVLELFLLPIPWRENQPKRDVTFDEFFNLVNTEGSGYASITFDNVFSRPSGYVGRHTFNNNPNRILVTWRYDQDGTSHFTIPFSSISLEGGYDKALQFFKGYQNTAGFFKELHKRKFSTNTIVDLNFSFGVLLGLIRLHYKLATLVGPMSRYSMILRLRGVAGRVPFLDTELYKGFIEKCGVPVIEKNEVECPPELGFYEVDYSGHASQDEHINLTAALAFAALAEAFGIPYRQLMPKGDWIEEVVAVLARALEVQKSRNP